MIIFSVKNVTGQIMNFFNSDKSVTNNLNYNIIFFFYVKFNKSLMS